jgi:hypothetical protein
METHVWMKFSSKYSRFPSEKNVLLVVFLPISFDNMIGQLLQKVVDSEESWK